MATRYQDSRVTLLVMASGPVRVSAREARLQKKGVGSFKRFDKNGMLAGQRFSEGLQDSSRNDSWIRIIAWVIYCHAKECGWDAL